MTLRVGDRYASIGVEILDEHGLPVAVVYRVQANSLTAARKRRERCRGEDLSVAEGEVQRLLRMGETALAFANELVARWNDAEPIGAAAGGA